MQRSQLAVTVVVLAACAAYAGATQNQPAGARFTEERLQHEGRDRRFLVHDFSGGDPAPAVIVLHGGGGHPENAVNMSQMDLVAARERLIAVYPAGTGAAPGGRLLTWNATHCCAYARENKVDDVGFISKMIETLVSSRRVDPKRVYVTGMSNGGMMSHVLGRMLPGQIAAIAPVVGAIFGDERPATAPMPAVIFVGQLDENVPAAGGPLGGPERRGRIGALLRRPEDHNVAPDIAQAEYWAKANGCSAPTERTDAQGKPIEIRWERCTSGAPVHFYRVADNGHAWPGGRAGRPEADPPATSFNASDVMWRFFRDNPKK